MASRAGSVAVLGTGIMGAAIARNLAAADLETAAWNRNQARAEPLGAAGVEVFAEAPDAVRGRDAVITMLAGGDAVRAVMSGALEAIGRGAIWIQASTVGIASTDELVAMAEGAGARFLDAPVLGTRQPAESGELVVLASGDETAADDCEPILEAIGSKTVWLGEAGRGTRMKLVVNNWLLTLTAGLAETIALAEALGLAPGRFLEVIDGAPMGSPYAQSKGAMMLERGFEPSFPLGHAAKDARLVVEAADLAGADLALAATVAERFATALERGEANEDMAAVYRAAAGDQAGGRSS